ncbi:hypothetical protein [Shewanella phage FishSpeaker]|nr:hypothetical protein [Shewanella phage FishSpeaker]
MEKFKSFVFGFIGSSIMFFTLALTYATAKGW